MAFVDAYAVATGRPHLIPEHWLADPIIGPGFTLTPPAPPALPAPPKPKTTRPRRGTK